MHHGREVQTACKEELKALPANRLSVRHSAFSDDGLETTTERCRVGVPALGAERREGEGTE